ncbi:hypothetical protein AAHC03_022987 [Spirometra sp. Aus1]|nr:unnamed protein product [Spirometra erinaceieuropaei]
MSRGIPKEGKSEIDEILRRLCSHNGVSGVIVCNTAGIPIRTTMENSLAVHHCALIQNLMIKARAAVRDLDPTNDLTFLRLRSKKNEIMVAPRGDFFLIVVQKSG